MIDESLVWRLLKDAEETVAFPGTPRGWSAYRADRVVAGIQDAAGLDDGNALEALRSWVMTRGGELHSRAFQPPAPSESAARSPWSVELIVLVPDAALLDE